MKSLGIDIGGSFIKFGIQSEGKLIHNTEVANSATNLSEFKSLISKPIAELENQFSPSAIGVGFPGTVGSSGIVVSSPNMKYWEGENIQEWFSGLTALPTFIQNDAFLAGFAESRTNKLDEYYFVTLGTGIGSVLVRDGELVSSKYGSSGELGHIILNLNDKGEDYRTGIFEKFFNANRFIEKAKEDKTNFPNSMMYSLDKFSIRELSDAVNMGDDLAIVNFMEMGKILGIGLSSAANLTGIPIFVIGGGISQVNNLLFDTALSEMKKRVIPELKEHVQILKSKLYNEAGILGAALFAMEKIE